MKYRAVFTWALALSLLAGCSGGTVPVKPAPESPVESPVGSPAPESTPAAISSAALEQLSANELVLRLLEREQAHHPGENVILSPLSIEMALGMAANGASGEAADALQTVFGLDAKQLNLLLRPWLEREDKTLSIANSMWFNETLQGGVSQTFEDTLLSVYQAGEGIFQTNSTRSAEEINAWVRDHTQNKIDSIVTADALTEETLGLLVNALYFNGKWVDPFEEYQVSDGIFHTVSGEQDAEFMRETLDTYFESETATGFSKAYRDGYEFIGILPKAEGEPDLTGLNLDEFLASETRAYDVDIRIPKFELSFATSLKQTLTEMGLGSLFQDHALDQVLTEEAQAAGQNVRVSDVLHKTYVKMYEQGTEAAAVTSVILECGSAMPEEREIKQVYLDRPFAFLIRDWESGQVIFCGVVDTIAA